MTRWVVAGLFLAGVLGLILLPYPFGFDQAQYTYAARLLSRGAVLYADVWDPKQPGLFLFFLAGGWLFGFNEVGIHLFELIYLLAGVGLIAWVLRKRFRSRIAHGMVPVLTVGAYYASARAPNVLTQLEWLVGIPLFASLWLAIVALGSRKRLHWLLSGTLGGIVVLFKSLLLLVVFAVWFTVLFWSLRNGTTSRREAFRGLVWLAAGGLLSWLPFGLYVAVHGLWDLVVFTYLEYPRMAIELFPPSPLRLAKSTVKFAVLFSPLIFLAAAFLARLRPKRVDSLTLGLIAWLLSGTAVVLMQHWWSYHFYLLLWPIAILASLGLDEILAGPRARGRLWAGIAVLCAPLLYYATVNLLSLVDHRFAIQPQDRLAYQTQHFGPHLSAIVDEVAFLREEGTSAGPLYVLGNPTYLYRAGRDMASPIIGGIPEVWPPELWEQTLTDLKASRPPFIFVQDGYGDYLETRGPELGAWIASTYHTHKQGSHGTWYRRSDLDP